MLRIYSSTHKLALPSGIMVRALDLRLKRSRVRIPAVPLSGNNLGQVIHIHVRLSPSSIMWYRSTGADDRSSGTSGVSVAMRHRLQWFIHVRSHAYEPTLLTGYDTLYLTLLE